MLARQIRTITARTSAVAVKCANVANTRRESLRKLAELRPLPVIKSKEGRRYAEYAGRPWSDYGGKGHGVSCTVLGRRVGQSQSVGL
ncbi:hypothetical protein QLX08_000418 [Tetragonisca angustula]|uniref:Uncharacterized protein n=1 Tax=Tetragonisca angustula TaxID=166442 RepID=A0AAW1AJW1_9HYME